MKRTFWATKFHLLTSRRNRNRAIKVLPPHAPIRVINDTHTDIGDHRALLHYTLRIHHKHLKTDCLPILTNRTNALRQKINEVNVYNMFVF